MSDQTDIRQAIAPNAEPSSSFAVAAFAGLPIGGLVAWGLLWTIFDESVALLMFLLVVAAILSAENRIADYARGLKPPKSLDRVLYAGRRIRLAQALAYAPLFAFCFVREVSPAALGEWAGGYLLVFGLMFSASETSAAAARMIRTRRRRLR